MDTVSARIGSAGGIEVIVPVVGVESTTACWEVDGPPFSNGTCSATINGSSLVLSHSCNKGFILDGMLLSIGGFNSGVTPILSSH